jgi:hypothetical protein
LCLCKRRVEVAGARVGVRPAQHTASGVVRVAVARMSECALESIVEERVESGWNVGVAAFWAADPAEGALMQPCSAPSGGVDSVQRPSPTVEAWSEACSKGRSQVDDRFLWRAAAHGEKTGDARNVAFMREEFGSWVAWALRRHGYKARM